MRVRNIIFFFPFYFLKYPNRNNKATVRQFLYYDLLVVATVYVLVPDLLNS